MLGNFGTGKSTFCRKYAYDLAQKGKTDRGYRIPVVIDLRDYDSRYDIQHLILNTLQNRFGLNITLQVSIALQRLGKFVFLFDGLDEMEAKATPDTVRENIRELNKISEIRENRLIITCRTHFFRNKLQVEVFDNFEILYIPEWSEIELEQYLKKRFGKNWRQYLKRITLPTLYSIPSNATANCLNTYLNIQITMSNC